MAEQAGRREPLGANGEAECDKEASSLEVISEADSRGEALTATGPRGDDARPGRAFKVVFPPPLGQRLLCGSLVIAFIGLYLCVNSAIFHADNGLSFSDGHYSRAVNTFMYLQTGDRTFLERHGEPIFSARVPSVDRYPRFIAYPPVTYLVTSFYFWHGGISPLNLQLSLLPFSALFLLALFGIGRELGGGTAGLAAMALGAAAPQVLYISRMYLLDLPQTATTAAALYVLLRCDGYRNRPMTLLYGVALVLAFLTKWSAGLFLWLPTVWFILPALKTDRRARTLGCIGLALIAAAGTGTWVSELRCENPRAWVDEGTWLWYCLAAVELPTLAFALGLWKLEHRWRAGGEYRGTDGWRMGGFLWMGMLALSAIAPWYFWALGDLRSNLVVNAEHSAVVGGWTTLRIMWHVLGRFFPGAAVLLPAGIVAALVVRQGRSVRLLFLLNLVMAAVVLLQTGRPENFVRISLQSRLMLSVILFAAPLAVFWIGRTGRLAWPLALGSLGVSAALLTGWFWGPDQGAPLERMWGSYAKVFFSPHSVGKQPPEIAPPKTLLDLLANLDKPDKPFESVLLMPSPTLPWEMNFESIYVGALAHAHKIVVRADQLQWLGDDNYRNLLTAQRERLKTLDYIVFVQSVRWQPEPFLKALKEAWPPGAEIVTERRVRPGQKGVAIKLNHPLEP